MITDMVLSVVQLFIKFCMAYVVQECDYDEKKRLSASKREEIISLLDECLVMAFFLRDTETIAYICNALASLHLRLYQPAKQIHSYENMLTLIYGGEFDLRSIEMVTNLILGDIYESIGQYHKAIKYNEKSLSLAKDIGDREGEGNAYGSLGIAYQSIGKFHQAIEYHENSLSVAKEIGDRQGEVGAYGNLGVAYLSLEEFHKAIEYLEKSQIIAKEIGDRQGEGTTYGYLAYAYQSLADFQKAIEYYEKILSIAQEIGDREVERAAYGILGYAYDSLCEYYKAIEYHEKSLSIAQEIGDREGEGTSYGNLGVAFSSLGKYHKAIEYHEKSLSMAKEIGNRQGEGGAYGNLGAAYKSLGEFDKAIEYLEKGLSMFKEIGDRQGEGTTYGNLGSAYHSLGEYHKAIEHYEKRLSMAKEIGDRQGEVACYGYLGAVMYSLGKYHKAIEYLETTLSIAQEIGDRQGEANAYGNLGLAYHSLGETHKAFEYHEMRLSIAKEIGDRRGEGTAYGILGYAYDSFGEYHKAIECQEKKLSITQEIGDRQGEGTAYGNLGAAISSLGKYHKAIEHFEKTLSIAKQIGDRRGEGTAYVNLGSVIISSLGKYHKAIEYLEKGLRMFKEIGDRHGEGCTYGNLGAAYYSLGEFHKAIEYHEKTLSIAKEIADRNLEGTSYGHLGIVYHSLGEFHKAIEYHEKILSIAKEIGDRKGECTAYGNLGIACNSLGEHHKAIHYHEKRLNIAQEIGDRKGEGIANGDLGLVYQSLGEYHKAIEYHNKSLRLLKEIGDIKGQATSHQNTGLVYQDESSIKDLSKSKEHLEKSIQCYEKLFDDLKDNDQFKVSIVDTFITAYKLLSKVYIETRQIEEALLVCERGRARALRDLLFLKYNTTEKTEPKELYLADFNSISSHCEGCILFYSLHFNNVSYHSWIISSRSPSLLFYDELDNHEAFATFASSMSEDEKASIKMGYFQYLVDNCFQQLNVREGKGMNCEDRSMNLLDHEDLESAPSTNSSQLSENDVKVFQKVDRCILDEEDDDVEPLNMLFYILVSPVLDQLTHDQLIIIPDGYLFMMPFAALQDPKTGKYLSEAKRIRLAPSLTTVKILQDSSHDQHGGLGALIIGNPTTGHVRRNGRTVMFSPLRGAEDEALQIGNLLGVEPLIGIQATKETVLRRLKQGVSIIHFAAHGSKENGQIALASSKPTTYLSPAEEKDCILTMQEVQEIGIRAQLVVLSCCYSGRGDIKSEGVVGMTRAFLAAGARAVVASLWAIDDEATVFFMLKFYSHLKNGESASKSLQQAMKDMREIYEEPMFWAGFFLIGDDVTITV